MRPDGAPVCPEGGAHASFARLRDCRAKRTTMAARRNAHYYRASLAHVLGALRDLGGVQGAAPEAC